MKDAYDGFAALRLRVQKEFQDLPGLRLTRWQAARLWNLQPGEYDVLLERLVAAKVLRRTVDGFAAGELCQPPRQRPPLNSPAPPWGSAEAGR